MKLILNKLNQLQKLQKQKVKNLISKTHSKYTPILIDKSLDSLTYLYNKTKKLLTPINKHLQKHIDKNLESVLFDSISQYDSNIRKGSIVVVNNQHTIPTYKDNYISLNEKQTLMFFGTEHSYEYNPHKNNKEIQLWFIVLLDGKQTLKLDAYQVTYSVKNKWLTSITV